MKKCENRSSRLMRFLNYKLPDSAECSLSYSHLTENEAQAEFGDTYTVWDERQTKQNKSDRIEY